MGRVYTAQDEGWTPIERRGADQVESHVVLTRDEGGGTRLSLTRIAAGGAFGPHIDDYSHVFYVAHGHGEAMVGRQRRGIGAGDVVTTEVREPHGLWAAADAELVLVTANVYPEKAG